MEGPAGGRGVSVSLPAGEVIYHGPAHTEEWYAARSGGVTASEIAAICGLSKWESRFALYHRKAGTIPPQEQTKRMTAGLLLEGAIRDWFADEMARPIVVTDVVIAHRDRRWQKASPDALVEDGTLEAKTVSYGDEADWGTPGTNQIPPYYRVQGMWQMDVTGLPTTWFPVLFSNFRFEWYRLDYDADDAAWLRSQAEEFLADLANGRLPDLDGHAATYQAVRKLHPLIDRDRDIDLPPEIADRYRAAKLACRNAEIEDSHASAVVLDAMGDARRAYCNGDYIARREAKGDGTPYLKSAIKLTATTTEESAA
jgi:putative phage-type endonuclease